jgi:hypothetical protein
LKSWADRILGIHVDFENQCNDNKNKISSGLSVAREKCDHLSQEAASTLDLQVMRRTEQLSANEAQTEEMLDSVSNSREAVSTTTVQDNITNCSVILLLDYYLLYAVAVICLLVDAKYMTVMGTRKVIYYMILPHRQFISNFVILIPLML